MPIMMLHFQMGHVYKSKITLTRKALGEKIFDFVLFVGRARVAASVTVLSYLHDKSVVVFHDANRIFEKRFQ